MLSVGAKVVFLDWKKKRLLEQNCYQSKKSLSLAGNKKSARWNCKLLHQQGKNETTGTNHYIQEKIISTFRI